MANTLANLHEPKPQAAEAKRAYNVAEACSTLSIKRTLLFELLRRREIASVKVGRRRLIIAASLDAYLDRLVAEQSD
jgi:excisionase family DNA binding protein